MPPFRARIVFCIAGLAALLLASPAAAMPNVQLIEEDQVLLTVRPMNAQFTPGSPIPAEEIELEDRGTELTLFLEWPETGQRTEVVIEASPLPPRPGAKHVILLEAVVRLPDGSTSRSSREMVFDEQYTSLFEVHRERDRTLVLAIKAEHYRDTRLSILRETGEPIQFQIEIQRVEGDRSVSLETNRLNTFVGDPVAYSFQLGAHGEGESLRIRLTPRKLYGDLAKVEVDISGMLSNGEQTSMISRTEDWLTTRGATSSLSVAEGDPPTGYKFLVTPWF